MLSFFQACLSWLNSNDVTDQPMGQECRSRAQALLFNIAGSIISVALNFLTYWWGQISHVYVFAGYTSFATLEIPQLCPYSITCSDRGL